MREENMTIYLHMRINWLLSFWFDYAEKSVDIYIGNDITDIENYIQTDNIILGMYLFQSYVSVTSNFSKGEDTIVI